MHVFYQLVDPPMTGGFGNSAQGQKCWGVTRHGCAMRLWSCPPNGQEQWSSCQPVQSVGVAMSISSIISIPSNFHFSHFHTFPSFPLSCHMSIISISSFSLDGDSLWRALHVTLSRRSRSWQRWSIEESKKNEHRFEKYTYRWTYGWII